MLQKILERQSKRAAERTFLALDILPHSRQYLLGKIYIYFIGPDLNFELQTHSGAKFVSPDCLIWNTSLSELCGYIGFVAMDPI